MIFLRVPFHWQILAVPIPIFFEFVFCVGVGLILAALSVYFRDINHLYGVLTLAWMYATPIFYPLEALPERVIGIIKFNPLYHYIQFFRLLIMEGYIPGINTWLACIVSSFASLLIGVLLFRRLQRNFILYL
jgi:ABC-type polysaccharide/polyol phosphate export permease